MTRRRMMGVKESGAILPSEYQQVEWIKSSAYQYIDTGIPINSDCGMEIEAEWTYSNNTALIGCGMARNSSDYGFGTWNNILLCQYNESLGTVFTSDRVVYSCFNGKFFVNGELKKEKQASFSIGRNVFVFWANLAITGGWGSNKATAKVYYAKVFDNTETTVCHLIPCYRKSDGEIGMFDIISNTFKTNLGTGTFTKGADV